MGCEVRDSKHEKRVEKGQCQKGANLATKFRKRFPQSRRWGPGSGDKNAPPGQATKRLPTTRGKDWAPSRTSGTSGPSIAGAMECLRVPRSSFARQRAKKHLVCGAGWRGEAVSLLLVDCSTQARSPKSTVAGLEATPPA